MILEEQAESAGDGTVMLHEETRQTAGNRTVLLEERGNTAKQQETALLYYSKNAEGARQMTHGCGMLYSICVIWDRERLALEELSTLGLGLKRLASELY